MVVANDVDYQFSFISYLFHNLYQRVRIRRKEIFNVILSTVMDDWGII